MRIEDVIEVKWNLEIDLFERGKRERLHQRTHNIFTNVGRQFLCENMSAAAFPTASSFTRIQDSVVRYIGFGVGGVYQNSSIALATPFSDPYPVGYGGTNAQTDADVTVNKLERPVEVTPGLWMKEVAPIPSLVVPNATTFIATFSETDLQVLGASTPLSEIGLFKSTADPALPNGSAGVYPGAGGHAVAYDTFNTLHKTGQFSIEVRWTIRF